MNIRVRTPAVLFSLTVALSVACAPYTPPSEEAKPAEGRQRNVITHDEILSSPHRQVDLFQAIRGLRPHFLAAPIGNRTRTNPALVYVDGVRQQGGLASLASIPAASAERIEYLDPTRAESQFGSVASGGAVMVTLVGQGRAAPEERDRTSER